MRRSVFLTLLSVAPMACGDCGTTASPPPPGAVAVASVAVNPAAASVQAGGTTTLTATPRDANNAPLTGRSIAWSTSAAAVATVANGVVTAVSAGSAVITATSEGKSGTATITVTPPPPAAVATVVVTPATANVQVGGTTTLSAETRAANNAVLTGRAVTWSTSAQGVATVANGVVTAVSVGTTTITATSEGKSGTATITVTAPPPAAVATVVVTPGTANVQVGGTTTLAAETRAADNTVLAGRVITWGTSAPAVATVANGVVTAVSAGTTTITATSEGQTGSATIVVTAPAAGPPSNVDVLGVFTVSGPLPLEPQTWSFTTQDAGAGTVTGTQQANTISGTVAGSTLVGTITYASPAGYVATVHGTIVTVGSTCEITGIWGDTNGRGGTFVAVRPGVCAPQTPGGTIASPPTLDVRGTFTSTASGILPAQSWLFATQDSGSGAVTGSQQANTIAGTASGTRLVWVITYPGAAGYSATLSAMLATDGSTCRMTGVWADTNSQGGTFTAVRPGPCVPR